MRALVVYCHPVAESFNAAVRDAVVRGLERAGHEVDLIDLYGEGFDALLSREERLAYHTPGENTRHIAGHLARVKQADALVFVAPTWWYGPPAMLKGWLDRVRDLRHAKTLPPARTPAHQYPRAGGSVDARLALVLVALGRPAGTANHHGRGGRHRPSQGAKALAGLAQHGFGEPRPAPGVPCQGRGEISGFTTVTRTI